MRDRCVLLNGADAARQHFRVVLTGYDDADQSCVRGIRVVPSGQRILDQISVPQFHSVAAVVEHLRYVSDRELVPLALRSLCVSSVSLRQFEAERAVNPGSDRTVVLIIPRPLFVQTVLPQRSRALKSRGLSLSGIDHCKRRRAERDHIAKIEGRQECVRRPFRLEPGIQMDSVLCNPVFISVEQVDLRMSGKIVLHQHHREFIGLAVIVTGNYDVRCLMILCEQMILKMRIAHYFRREFLPFCMVFPSDLFSKGLFMGKIPVVVCSDCHVQRTPLFTVIHGSV